MNILIIAHYQDDGSTCVSYVENQAIEYMKLGHDVTIISPVVFGKKYKYRQKKKLEFNGLNIYYPRYLSLSNYGKYNVNNYSFYRNVNRIFKKLQKEKKYDIIHAHTIGLDGSVATKLKKKYNLPLVITTHGTDTIREIENGKGYKISEICSKADVVIAVSNKLKSLLLQENSSLNVKVITNGFSVYFNNLVYEKKRPNTLIQVSSLITQKKVDTTIRAFSSVSKKIKDARLIIIGDGEQRSDLESLCSEMGVSKNVEFLGELNNEEVIQRMSESQIFVMPSVNEGFGIVYIEAMSQKCVVIGSRGEGIEDIIEDGVNGFLIDPYNNDEIEECIYHCMIDDKLCQNVAEKGFETVKKLTWENNAKKYIKIMSEIITSRER